jgi:hypothetical protein
MPVDTTRPLWRCPKCGAHLVTANMWHSCGRYTLKGLFARSEPHVFRIFKKYERMVRACGPVTMIPQKTRVVFLVRVRHAGAYPRKNHLLCSFALPYRCEDPRFVKIEQYSPHFVGHYLRVNSEDQLDARVQKWLMESYAVGTQEVLQTKNRRKQSRQ